MHTVHLPEENYAEWNHMFYFSPVTHAVFTDQRHAVMDASWCRFTVMKQIPTQQYEIHILLLSNNKNLFKCFVCVLS